MPFPSFTSCCTVPPMLIVQFRAAIQRRIAAWAKSFPACPPSAVIRTQPSAPSGHCGPPCHESPVKCGRAVKFLIFPLASSNCPYPYCHSEGLGFGGGGGAG